MSDQIGILEPLWEEPPTQPITEEELDPKNWEITTMETECGFPCTPNGCCGHSTDIPEYLCVGGFNLSFHCEDFSDTQEFRNAATIGKKLREVFDFYSANHKKLAPDPASMG